MKKCWVSLLLTALLLSACGGASAGGSYSASSGSAPAAAYEEAYDGAYDDAYNYGYAGADTSRPEPQTAAGAANGLKPPANVKMIYTASVSLESTEFDAAAAGLDALTAELGGWYEHSSLDNSSRNYRRASFTIRLPAAHFTDFCTRVGDICKVNSISTSSEDISERYYDLEARLATQRTKLERLQDLLAQAKKLEDIITLESAISETELEIENLTGSLRKYDSLVDYATVELSLSEVYQLTQTEEPVIGFGARLASAFRSGTRRFVSGMQDLLLGFARAWAGWLLFAAIVAGIVLLIRRARRRRALARSAGGGADTEKRAKKPPLRRLWRRRGRDEPETDAAAAPPSHQTDGEVEEK